MSVPNTPVTDETPRVWIGCLHCYNAGYLVGEWFPARGADEVGLSDVHKGTGHLYPACEELWCLDHEFIPVRHEFGPLEAAEWGRVFEEVGQEQWPAVCAWVESGDYVARGDSELPVIADFEERYCGHWDSFREYAEDLADQTGLTAGWPDTAVDYFNYDAWTRDLRHDYVVVDAPDLDGHGVYVFRSL